jgi:RNA polymerase sigma factor (sigma-70 family)
MRGNLLCYLRSLAAPSSADALTDGQLLRAYCVHHDQSAFAALVQRHGSLVLSVCRRVLERAEDQEDAFQATFLALARTTGSVRQCESLAGWLHGVARHIALDACRAAARRKRHEDQAMTTPAKSPAWEAAWHEVQVVLDEEIARLPERYREPFVLCCLENQSRREAATRLGLKEGTVGSRLTEARRRLRQRLERRGVRLSAVLGAAALASRSATAHVTAALAATITTAAARMASGQPLSSVLVSAHVLHLIQRVPRTMFSSRATIGTLLLLTVSVAVSGLGVVTYHQLVASPAEPRPGMQVPGARAEPVLPARAGPAAKFSLTPAKGDRAVWKEKAPIETPGWLIGSVTYSSDGKLLVVGGNGHVAAFDPATHKEKWKADVRGSMGSFAAVAFTADQKSILATSPDGAQLLDPLTGSLGGSLEQKECDPTAIGVFPDKLVTVNPGNQKPSQHKVIFANARGCLVRTWLDSAPPSSITLEIVGNGKQPADPNAVPLAVDPEGKNVIVAGPIDPKTGKNVLLAWVAGDNGAGSPGNRLLPGHEARVVSAAWSRNGKIAVTGDASGRVIIWDARTMKETQRLEIGARVAAVAIAPNGRTAAAVAIGKRAEFYVWQTTQSNPGKPLHIDAWDFSGPTRACLAFSPDGCELAGSAINSDWLSRLGVLIGKLWVWELDKPESGQ